MRQALLIFVLTVTSQAAVTLPAVLTDHMVLQRHLPIHLWGSATPGEAISAKFRDTTQSATAAPDGRWSLYLPPAEPGGPDDLSINTITLHDILVGDVWLASGQSNMEFSLKQAENADTELAAANAPRIRIFTVRHNVSQFPLDDLDAAPWYVCTPDTARDLSAVAYYFALEQQAQSHVPIGIIQSHWGGTPVEAWTSLPALTADAALMPVFNAWSKMANQYAADEARRKAATQPLPWTPNQRLSWSPAGLYNAMIAPLTRFPINGVIWYQGESNASADRAAFYERNFARMITQWRRDWATGDFPFLFVQLANFKVGPEDYWPDVREAQRRTLALRHTAMAVTIDVGNPLDIHPKNKKTVGQRLALAARGVTGPMYRQAIPEPGVMRVYFSHNDGLNAKDGKLDGFEVAAADGKFVPAIARIEKGTVVASSDSVPNPAFVRYAWSSAPPSSLYNAQGLPASPFNSRSEP